MNRVRRGKDFKVLWSFFDYNGEPYQLDKTFLTLYVSNSFDRFEVTDFSVEENTITWIFRGKDQKALGDYTLELIQNNGTEGMIPIDSVDAFTLVQYSRDESLCGGGNVKIEDVTVNSTLDIETISSLIDAQLSEISVNPVQNKVITAALNNKADKSSVPTKTSQLTNDSGFITAEEAPAPDWNASTYKEGHIKNRTHHMQDYMCQYFKGSPIKISKPSDVGYVLLAYDTDLPEKFIRIEINANESKTYEFLDAMGMPIIFTWDAGNSTINVQSFGGAIDTYGMRAYYSSSAKGYDDYFVALDEGFIPEEVARKSELKTINGESILGEGDIEIKGGSSTFVTDFTVNDLYELVYRGAHPVQANIVALQRALENKERIVVPYGTEDLKGYSLLQGYYEDLVYFTVADENGSTYVVEVGQYAGEIDRDNITHVSPKDNKINIADLQNGKVNKTDVATINGKSIINGGNITIEGGEGSLDSEVVSSTEASEEFPQVLYVEQTLTEAQKSQARKNIGADNTELKEQITELSIEINGQSYPSFEVKQEFGQMPNNMKPFAFKKGEFSIKCVTDATNTNYVNVYLYDEDKQQVGDIFIAYNYAKTYAVEHDVAFVGIYMPSTQIVKDGEVTIVIEAEGTNNGIVGKIEQLASEVATKMSGEIVGVGKNLYNKEIELDGYIGLDQTLGANPTYQSTLPSYSHSDLIPVYPGFSYHIKAAQPCGGFYKLFLDKDKKVASLTDANGVAFTNAGNDVTLVAPSNAAFLVITTRFGGTSCVDLQVELGDKSTSYEDYKGVLSLPIEKLPSYVQEATKAALESKPKVEKLESLLMSDGKQKVYASAGDSLTQGTGAAVGAIDKTDAFYPLSGTAQKTYAYAIAKRNKMEWLNYGISGSTMGNITFNGISYDPFCVNRYNGMADGIDVISLWFGVNDSYYGKLAKAESWLSKTYGKKIYYPIDSTLQGTTAPDGTPYATNEQYMACISAEEEFNGVTYKGFELYKKQYEGLPTDTDDTTWWGAWNKVLSYLIEKYPFAKILIITGYGTESYLYDSAKAIAQKYGVLHLDLRDYGANWLDVVGQPSVIDYNAADFADRTYFKEYASGKVSVNEFRKRTMLYDGLHFNKYGYEYITPFIEKALNL